MPQTVIHTFYKFTPIADPEGLRGRVLAEMNEHRVWGTLVLAGEGVNGVIAGAREGVEGVLGWLRRQPGLEDIVAGESFADAPPFKRARVKLRGEIVTLGVSGVEVGGEGGGDDSGGHVDAAEWNALLDSGDVLVVDVRNEYEVRIGSFEGALNPHTHNFRDFPDFVRRHLDARRDNKVAMFCTGGVRCEKSAAYLKGLGFAGVFQLRGGILDYLARVPEAESRWRGECFVFDERVSVDHSLRKGNYDQCHACRAPISDADKRSAHYAPGAGCPHCHGKTSAADRARFAERRQQVELAARRGAVHIGPAAMDERHG